MNYIYIFLGIIAAIIIFAIIIGVLTKRKGRIDIVLDKYNYAPGEEITGKVILRLKKPVEANQLKVGLKGKMETQNYSSKKGTTTNEQDIYNFSYPIEGKKNFPMGDHEYTFKIKTPANVQPQTPEISGMLGNLVKVSQALSPQQRNIQWFIQVTLDSSGINLYNEAQVNIT
jgi:hypothetical protein